ncbi:MAG: adenylate/guanylate cyclase domain-containing protein [Acidobacteria bacterium]|nr:adenylate/guanylate cyclase domain-containing protein [Acidobacteriota bacterium]
MASVKSSPISKLLRRWYWALAALLTLAVWLGVALAMRPALDSQDSYATSPYGLVTSLENRALDLLFQLRDARRPALRARGLIEPVTIIEMDEPSIRASDVRLQKWPRGWYAALIDRAREGGAKAIGLDVYLSERGGTSAEDRAADQRLAEAIYNTENIVLVQKLEAGGAPALVPLPEFAENATAVGFSDFPLDDDNSVRSTMLLRAQPSGEAQFSFAAALVQLYAGQELKPATASALTLGGRMLPLRTDSTMQLDFRARTPGFRRVSAKDILCEEFKQTSVPDIRCDESAKPSDELFRDRIVLIGATNNDAPDLFQTPFYEPLPLARLFDRDLPVIPARMPGVELHATSAATMLFGNALVRPAYASQSLVLLLALAAIALAVFALRALLGFAAVVFVAIALLAISAWAFDAHGLVLPLASAWLGVAVLAPLGFVLRYARERALRDEKEAERAQIMDIFSRCVSTEVAEELWQKREQVSLVGETRIVTIIFTDIRNFTTLSETVDSKEVVTWLNDYFSRMHDIIRHYGGHINKYLGDGLMIVFGAPVDRGEKLEARAAVLCGLKMLEEVERMNGEWEGTGRPHIAIGVGIHTGEATCGVVGAPGRLEYTIIGDTVNLASRLESTTKEAGVPLVVSSVTAGLLGVDYETEALGNVNVKGKTLSTSVFAVRPKQGSKQESPPAVAAAGQ